MLAEVRGIDADWMPEGVVMKGAKGEGKKGIINSEEGPYSL